MAVRTQLLCICLIFSNICLFASSVASQEGELILNESILNDVPVLESIVDAPITAESHIQVDSPVEILVADSVPVLEDKANEAQCVTVKKSILGCMEGITILPQDEVWFVNARDYLCGEADLGMIKVSRIVSSDLVESSLSDLSAAHDSGDDFATVLYIHGNQTNEEFAISRGLQVYRNAFTKKAHLRQPIRYVIWAWKSEQEKPRFYPDYLLKSKRSVLLGETFAATLNQFNDRNVIVIGFSLGVQVALSAFDSPSLLPRPGDPTRYQVVFIAPAINADYVACHSLTMGTQSPVAQTCVFTNRKDRSICAARAIIRRKSSAKDATIAGLSDAGKLDIGKVTSIDVFEEAGRLHSVERYTRSGTLQTIMANLVNSVSANRTQGIVVSE